MRKSNANQAGESFPGHNQTTLEWLDVAKLKLLVGDPRRYSPRDEQLAVAALTRMPPAMPLPVIINGADEVLAGHLFVSAAKKSGIQSIHVVRHTGEAEIDEKRYAVMISQLLTKGEWDPGNLDTWIREFEASIEDFSHVDLGFANGELDRVLGIPEMIAGLGSDETIPDLIAVAVSRPGMIWQAGPHRILAGDATSRQDRDRLMAGHSAAMVITDPPFGCKINGFVAKKGKHREFVEGSGDKSPEELAAFFLAEIFRKAGWLLYGPDWLHHHLELMAASGYENNTAVMVAKLLLKRTGTASSRRALNSSAC